MSETADWITAGASVVGLGMIWWQLRLQNRQALYDALNDLHGDLISDEMHASLRMIYAAEADELRDPKDTKLLEAVERALSTYDLVGFRIEKGVLPKEAVIETEWSVLLRLWAKVEPFLREESLRRGLVPYKPHFQRLVECAQQYKSKHFPHERTTVFARIPLSKPPSESDRAESRSELGGS